MLRTNLHTYIFLPNNLCFKGMRNVCYATNLHYTYIILKNDYIDCKRLRIYTLYNRKKL